MRSKIIVSMYSILAWSSIQSLTNLLVGWLHLVSSATHVTLAKGNKNGIYIITVALSKHNSQYNSVLDKNKKHMVKVSTNLRISAVKESKMKALFIKILRLQSASFILFV